MSTLRRALLLLVALAPIDPNYRLSSSDAGLTLAHAAIAVQMPNLVHTLLPVPRFLGLNANRRGLIRPRQRDRLLSNRKA